MKIDLKEIKTYYINLDKDKDRDLSMKSLIKDFEFDDAHRFSGTYKEKNPISGCAQSHYNILSQSTGKFIILEDDCVIKNNTSVIEVPDDADAVYLGLSEWGYKRDASKQSNYIFTQHNEFKNVYKVDSMLATHAILYLSKDYLNLCTQIAKYSAENSVHIDQGFARIQRYYNVYAIADPIFYQASNKEATNIKFVRDRIVSG
jgi:hypothetical protein